MTFRQKLITTFYILKHKLWVFWYMFRIILVLLKRAALHDLSKFSKEEFEYVYILSTKGRGVIFGSKEYYDLVDCVMPAKNAHAKTNKHHPEYHEGGIDSMSVIDMTEMLADWFSASRRSGSDIYNSLAINKKKYKIRDNFSVALYRDIKEIRGDK